MKRLCLIILLFWVLSGSTSFAGSFYNPDPEGLRDKGREAAEKLNESFVIFYEMLKNIEGENFDMAKENKKAFDKLLKDEVLGKFKLVYQDAPNLSIRFPKDLNPKLQRLLNYIQQKYLKNQIITIDTTKKMVELPVTMLGLLIKKSSEFQIKPEKDEFFSQLRSLIIVAIDVQWVGVKVSELWAGAIYGKLD